MASLDEADTVRRCQAGEKDAYRLVVEQYGNVLFGTAYLMLRDRGLAEDVVQEAFVSGWKGIQSFDGMRSLRPWLLRILVNHVLQRKRRKFLPVSPLSSAAYALPSETMGPEQALEKAWERHEVRMAMAKLPDDFARVIVLRYFAGLSLQEIAEALNLPEGTVKSRLHRALQRLQKELAGRELSDEDGKRREEEGS